MFSTKSILKTIPLAMVLLSFGFSSLSCHGQSDDATEGSESPRKPTFNNPFSKMFSKREGSAEEGSSTAPKSNKPPSNSKPALSSARPGKPAIAATPTSNRGGLLMPLKSFTNRVFRSNEDTQEQLPQPTEDLDSLPSKPGREPFRNVPRPRFTERREERLTNDISVQPMETAKSMADSSGINALTPPPTAKPAPIVRNESQFGTNSKSVNQKPSTAAIPPAPIVPSLEMNSTSRRTGDLQSESNVGATTPSTISVDTETTLMDLSTESRSKKSTNPVSLPPSRPTNRFADDSTQTSNSITHSSGSSGSKSASTVSRRSASTPTDGALEISSKSSESTGTPMVSSIRTRSDAKPKTDPAPKSASTKQEPASGRNASIAEMSQPGVRVFLNGPDSLLVGQDAVYEIVAKNEGTSDLSGLLFRMSVPASVTLSNITATEGTAQPDHENGENAVGWELENLSPGTAKTLRFTLLTQQPEHFAMGVEWTSLPNTSQLQISVQQPKLDLALEGPSEAEFGTPQNYRLRIKNPGNAVVKAVEIVLTAETFGSNQSVIGDIQPGSERIVDVELLFQQHGVIPIVATATSAVSKLQARNSIDVRVKQSSIVAHWNGPTEFYQGSIAEYSLTLTNQGEAPALNIPCTVRLPQGADPVSLPAGATRRGNVVQWEMKRLLPLETITIPFSLMMGNVGNNTLSFSAESKNGTAPSTEITTNVDSIADLKLTVIDPVAPAPIGQPVFYEIEISNRGRKAANSVEVIAQFSDGIEPIRVDGHAGRIVPGQVIFTPIPSIGPGEKVTLKVAAEAKSAGVHRFRAEVKSASSDTDLIHEESTRYLATGVAQPTRR